MKMYVIKDRNVSYHFLKNDFKSAYDNNGHNIPLAIAQVATLRGLEKDFVEHILHLYIHGIQYKNK